MYVDNGINYQPQLVNLPDFWWPSTIITYSIYYQPLPVAIFSVVHRRYEAIQQLRIVGWEMGKVDHAKESLSIHLLSHDPWDPVNIYSHTPRNPTNRYPKWPSLKLKSPFPNYDFGYLSLRGDVPRFIWVTNPSSELLMLLGLAPAQFGALSILWFWNQSRSLKPPPLKKNRNESSYRWWLKSCITWDLSWLP